MKSLVEKLDPADLQVMGNRQLFSRLSFNAREHHCLFVNGMGGNGKRFLEAGYPLGLDVDQEGRGVAVADLDGDGRLDLLVRAVARRKLTYFHNDAAAGHFLRVELQGTRSNRDGVGALVRLSAGGVEQMRTKTAGSGFQGQSEGTLHFGLGNSARAARLRVQWPSGLVEEFFDVPADRVVRIVEGQGKFTATAPSGSHAPEQPSRPAAATQWSAHERDGKPWRFETGKPMLLTFWASWCVPCRAEVPALNELARKLGGRVEIAGVTFSETEPGAAERFLRETKPEYRVLFSTRDEMAALLEKLFPEGDIPLPSALLIDSKGIPRRLFRGAVPERVLQSELLSLN